MDEEICAVDDVEVQVTETAPLAPPPTEEDRNVRSALFMLEVLKAIIVQGHFKLDLSQEIQVDPEEAARYKRVQDELYEMAFGNGSDTENVNVVPTPQMISHVIQGIQTISANSGTDENDGGKDARPVSSDGGKGRGSSGDQQKAAPRRLPLSSSAPGSLANVPGPSGQKGHGAQPPNTPSQQGVVQHFTARERGSTGSSISSEEEPNPFEQDRKPRCCPLCTIM